MWWSYRIFIACTPTPHAYTHGIKRQHKRYIVNGTNAFPTDFVRSPYIEEEISGPANSLAAPILTESPGSCSALRVRLRLALAAPLVDGLLQAGLDGVGPERVIEGGRQHAPRPREHAHGQAVLVGAVDQDLLLPSPSVRIHRIERISRPLCGRHRWLGFLPGRLDA